MSFESDSKDNKLQAAAVLDNMSVAFDFTDRYYLDPLFKPKYFLIKYNNITKTVKVELHNHPKEITRIYHECRVERRGVQHCACRSG